MLDYTKLGSDSVSMETQGFMPDMQPLNPGRVQQSSPVQQNAVQTTTSQAVQTQVVTSGGGAQVSPASPSSQTSAQTTVVQVSTTNGTPQFIAVAVADPEVQGQATVTLQPTPAVHPTYVQYVDGSGDPNLYTTTNGQMSGYPMYSVSDGGMYTPSNAAYYSTASGTPVTYSQVQWLIDNYETAEGVSLPRSTLYNHYLRHCAEHKLEPVNAASFGKLIRSVFLGLRTRRLGTRGNSKYHYYGIRVKPNSPLNQISEEVTTTALRQQSVGQAKRFRPSGGKGTSENHDSGSVGTPAPDSSSGSQPTAATQQHQQYLGDASSAVPELGDLDFGTAPLLDGVREKDLEDFSLLYRDHLEAFLEAVMNLQFSAIESLWQSLWRQQGSDHGEQEKVMSKSKLFLLCKCKQVQTFVQKADYQFYQNLVDVLIPDVLRPIPSSLTQAIRNFAKSLEGWLTNSMQGCPEEMVKVKVGAVSAFAQTLRRYTSLNHLAQAARAVLQNSSQINQMLADLNRVDFHNVQEQASWVCQCEGSLVERLEQDFKSTLQQQTSLEQWAAWLDGVVTLVLEPFRGKPDFPKAARQFLLKWSFYSSMVIRDLTLRSAASFGSFHLIRLLYDEYMFYLVEHKVSKATGKTPIAVMGEFLGMGPKQSTGEDFENGSDGTTSYTNTNGWPPTGLIGQPQVAELPMAEMVSVSPAKKLKNV
ncbi:DNA-binding protein RFX2-like isoform X6 [Ornithodoros turicata]|uniref:DNA-binding protein RFX2-like isoform X6 n=1 Tax=Ornithodoros turicata TaxID=34597 RepID=UPI0031399EA1